MAKLSLITVIWVWHCAVYGQLPVNNFGPYHSYYAPYPSLFVVQQPNDGISSQSGGTGELGNPLKTFSFQDTMTYKMSQLEAKIASLTLQLKETNVKLGAKADQTALDTTKKDVTDLTESLKTTNTKLEAKAEQTALDITKKDVTDLTATLKITNTKLDAKAEQTALDTTKQDVSDLKVATSPNPTGKVPTSCGDLKTIGFVKSGIYSIMDSKQVKNVYCDFTKTIDAELQKMIGTVDVKSTPIYFYAQMTASYSTVNTAIPFGSVKLNVGNAFTSSTGIFVAPTQGKYYFAYSGIAGSGGNLRVDLQLLKSGTANWALVGEANSNGVYQTCALHSTLELLKGDQVRLYLTSGIIYENTQYLYTNYVGWLIEDTSLTV